jgi:hypothetical protein
MRDTIPKSFRVAHEVVADRLSSAAALPLLCVVKGRRLEGTVMWFPARFL